MYRAKYTTTGTYADNTNVRIDLMTDGLTAFHHGAVTMITAYLLLRCAELMAAMPWHGHIEAAFTSL